MANRILKDHNYSLNLKVPVYSISNQQPVTNECKPATRIQPPKAMEVCLQSSLPQGDFVFFFQKKHCHFIAPFRSNFVHFWSHLKRTKLLKFESFKSIKIKSKPCSCLSGNAFALERQVRGSNLGPVKSDIVLPTARHRSDISSKGAVLPGRNDA